MATSPLDSTISGSWKENDDLAVGAAGAAAVPTTMDSAAARPRTRSSIRRSRSSASFGWRPQAVTSSSYSLRTEPPLTGPPVRTARSMVLRGVCWLSTNCTTSTR